MVVIGGGVAGLGAALGLGRAGWPVTVFDADELTPTAGPDDAFCPGTPGGPAGPPYPWVAGPADRHLAEPGSPTYWRVWSKPAASRSTSPTASATGAPATPSCGSCWPGGPRSTGSCVGLRRPSRRITLRGGESVAGVDRPAGGDGAPIDVGGVRLVSGRKFCRRPWSVVAGGRRAPIPRWLSDLGVEVPEEQHDTGIVYLTRWYRTAADWDSVIEGEELVKLAGDLGYLFFLAVPADRGAFSLTMAIGAGDTALRSQLRDPEAFDRAARRPSAAGGTGGPAHPGRAGPRHGRPGQSDPPLRRRRPTAIGTRSSTPSVTPTPAPTPFTVEVARWPWCRRSPSPTP